MNDHLSFYSQSSEDFFDRTSRLDLSLLYAEFEPYLLRGGNILDAGCGSGRDSRYFLKQGYDVHAIDAVPELATRATEFIGQKVEVTDFDSFDSNIVFDGIWACASLLHTSESDLPKTIKHLAFFLKTGAPFYMSFKYGQGETNRSNRIFTNMEENGVNRLANLLVNLRLEKSWITVDHRPSRVDEKWMNIIWIK